MTKPNSNTAVDPARRPSRRRAWRVTPGHSLRGQGPIDDAIPRRRGGGRLAAGLAAAAVLLVLAIAPWTFGAVHARTILWLLPITALAAAATMVFLGSNGRPGRVPVLLIPLLGLVALGVVQIVPHSTATLEALSSGAVAWRSDLGVVPAEGTTISLAPAETRWGLVNLVHASVVFLVAAWCVAEWPLVACWVLAGTGACVAFFGIVQQVSWNGMLYWSVPLGHGGQPFGPFVNRNHAGGYLEIAFAAAIALLAYELVGLRGRRGRNRRARFLAIGMVGVAIAGGLVAAGSRGTWLASAVGLLAVLPCALGIKLGQDRNGEFGSGGWAGARFTTVAGVLVVGMAGTWGLVNWSGESHAVRARAASLGDVPTTVRSRTSQWQATANAAAAFTPIGSGLGSHRHVVRAYETEAGPWYQHAENEYLDLWLELGWPGLVFVLLAAGATTFAVVTLLRGESRTDRALGLGAVFGCVACAAHAGFDFAIRTPAVTLSAGAALGLVAGRALRSREFRWNVLPVPRWAGVGVAGLACGALVVGIVEAKRTAEIEAWVTRTPEEEPWRVDSLTRRRELDRLEALAERGPSADLRLEIAAARSRLLRSVWIERLATIDEAQRRVAWEGWSNWDLHRYLTDPGTPRPIATAMRSDPRVVATFEAIRDDLESVRASDPLRSEPHLELALVEGILGTEPDTVDGAHLARAARVAPNDAPTHYEIGELHRRAGRIAETAAAWRHCLALSVQFETTIFHDCEGCFDAERFVREVLPEAPATLVRLVRERFLGPEAAVVRRMTAERVLTLLDGITETDADDWAETCWLRAAALREIGRDDSAVASYRRAVEARPGATTWRIELAETLLATGRIDESFDEARRSLALAPPHEKGRIVQLMQRISARHAFPGSSTPGTL